MELQEYLIEKLQLRNETDEKKKLEILDKKIIEIRQLLNEMDGIKAGINRKIAIEDRLKWESLLSRIKEEAASVSNAFALQKKVDFVYLDSEEDSHLCISFYKPDWELSIVFEKYKDQSFFTYIGISGEKAVGQKYLNETFVFSQHGYQNNHPYGWEYDEKYHQKPNDLIRDIENGSFEKYLENKVGGILQKIEEYQLPMK